MIKINKILIIIIFILIISILLLEKNNINNYIFNYNKDKQEINKTLVGKTNINKKLVIKNKITGLETSYGTNNEDNLNKSNIGYGYGDENSENIKIDNVDIITKKK